MVRPDGRVELGLGAGGSSDTTAAFGDPKRTPAESSAAFEDALHILRGMWANASKSFTYPVHRISIWAGAYGPKMLRLTGRLANGLFIAMPYVLPETLLRVNGLIDKGAQEAGRSPDAIRRGYNLRGVIRPGEGSISYPAQQGVIDGTSGYWADQIIYFYNEYHQDTFLFWGSGDITQQIEIFAQEVVPAVRERIALVHHIHVT